MWTRLTSWAGKYNYIYPIKIPEVRFAKEPGIILLDLPQRYMPMMPNGLGYVYNALKAAGVECQVVDCNIIFYHRYHSHRILKGIEETIDPWDNTSTGEWDKPDTIEHFKPWIDEIINGLAEAQPRIIGVSSSGSNRIVAREVIKGIRRTCPNSMVLVGGYDCMRHWLAPHLVTDYDYMLIGEADLSVAPLVKALLNGERPKDLPGILSEDDSPNRAWRGGPMVCDLDSIDFPRYEWTDISLYRDYRGNYLIPIVTTRGCHWGRCRFCSEGFIEWRERSPSKIADEIEWFAGQGYRNFHINDSDMNNNPATLLKTCEQIIRRDLNISFIGQARVRKENGPELFKHLRQAGCVHLRWGIDGWTDHVLRLQNKGYTMAMAEASLRYCHEAGIRTTANMVIGIPGETEQDIEESVKNILRLKSYIDCMENINILLLNAGSEYYNNPEKYGIHFYSNKEDVYKEHPYYIPHDQWYSDPSIDYEARLRRLHYIHAVLVANGIEVGGFAKKRAEEIQKGKGGQPGDWAEAA
ncbi:B12-binding domain-containing radical SAM protein [Chloroflexota bacterium]